MNKSAFYFIYFIVSYYCFVLYFLDRCFVYLYPLSLLSISLYFLFQKGGEFPINVTAMQVEKDHQFLDLPSIEALVK